jgi:hypothetical protein
MNLIKKIINREINGRWFLGGSHITLVIICILFFHLQRTPLQIGFGIFCGFLTEYGLYKLTNKYGSNLIFDRLFSAFTEVAGLLVLLKSHLWWFYGATSAITVASKYLLRKSRREHIFNPTNFAITIALCFFPIHWFEAWPDEYMRSWYPMMHVTAFGIIAVWLGGTWMVSLAYIISLIFWSFLFYPVHDLTTLIYAYGPEVGTIGLIYLFLMITDPKTAPKKLKQQIVYASAISFVHIYLRHGQYLYSRYIALFFITLIYFAISSWSRKKVAAVIRA